MIEYFFYANVGKGGSAAEFDLEGIRRYYFDGQLSDALIEYASNEGTEWSSFDSAVSDFDPYETEVYVSREEYEILKKEFPDAYEGDWDYIKIKQFPCDKFGTVL